MKTIVLGAPPVWIYALRRDAFAKGSALRRFTRALSSWWQAQRERRAKRRAHLALVQLGAPTLRDIGAGPDLLAAAHARDEAARWRRLELHLMRDEPRDPRTW